MHVRFMLPSKLDVNMHVWFMLRSKLDVDLHACFLMRRMNVTYRMIVYYACSLDMLH